MITEKSEAIKLIKSAISDSGEDFLAILYGQTIHGFYMHIGNRPRMAVVSQNPFTKRLIYPMGTATIFLSTSGYLAQILQRIPYMMFDKQLTKGEIVLKPTFPDGSRKDYLGISLYYFDELSLLDEEAEISRRGGYKHRIYPKFPKSEWIEFN